MLQMAPRPAAPLVVEPITDGGDLAALAPEWQALWRRVPGATPFQSPLWLLSWWRHLGGGELAVLALRQDGRLVGLVLLFVHAEDGLRRLVPLGIGISDYGDALLEPGLEDAGARALSAHLAAAAGQWSRCEFHELPAGSALRRMPTPAGWSDAECEQSACPALALPATLDGLERCLPRKSLRRARRRVQALGSIGFERAGPSTCGPIFDALAALHAERWRSRGEAGVLVSAAVRRFHQSILPGLAAAGLLRLYALRIDGRIVAVHYGFTWRHAHYAYLTGFDPACEHASVGSVLLAHVMEEAVREGCTVFDMLRGREPYKYRWGGTDRPTFRRILRPPAP
jgi:CelD/BcsL family acetyltransferase involved in cellulose biosynthesis